MKKLRFKFILVSMLSMIFVLVVIMVSIISVNYFRFVNETDNIIEMLSNNGGTFNDNYDHNIKIDMNKPNPPNKETPFETRYFTIRIVNQEYIVNTSQIASIDNDKAISMANEIINNDKGFLDIYRYKVNNNDDSILIIFVDCRRNIESITNLILSSLWISLIGIVGVFILVYFFSKKVFKPVENSIKKQKMFITNASHELKTPLTVISANNELIEMIYNENEYSNAIKKQLNKLYSMVNNLTLLARMDESSDIKKENINISDIVNEIIDTYVNVFKANNLNFSYDIDDRINFNCDSNLFREMIYLLLDNANKYSLSYVSFKMKKENKNIIITTCNDSNVNNESGNLLLERFYRSIDARGNINGSGLGLSLVNEIVLHHNGSINIDTSNNSFKCIIKF